jgi:hypothetical protein
MVSEVKAPGSGGANQALSAMRERIPVGRLNAYLWHRRSDTTCDNGGPHSGYRQDQELLLDRTYAVGRR